MKTPVGFAFTETPIFDLKQRGFSLFQTQNDENYQGFKQFIFPLSSFNSFEIHVVLDEDIYLSSHNFKNFEPFIYETKNHVNFLSHPNTITTMHSWLKIQDILNPELKNYLQLRKQFSLCALELQCLDLEKFIALAKPERTFTLENKKTALIHLGSHCFDLLVTQALSG